MAELGPDGDRFYELLMQTHEGLSEAESHALNARLVLLMANEIANVDKLVELMDRAGGNKSSSA